MLCVISSFLIVDGAIARSLYYAVILIFVYINLYSPKHAMWKILGLFMCGAVFVLIYWILRYSTSEEKSIQGFFDYFSRALSSYFSGVNVVSGSFNLPVTTALPSTCATAPSAPSTSFPTAAWSSSMATLPQHRGTWARACL